MPSIGFRAILEGPGDLLHATVIAHGERSSVTQDFFAYPAEFRSFGEGLASFPTSIHHEVTFEYGGSCFLRLRAFVVRPNGSSAIEVSYDSGRPPPWKASGLLYLPCYPATVNALGSALVAWSSQPDRELLHRWSSA